MTLSCFWGHKNVIYRGQGGDFNVILGLQSSWWGHKYEKKLYDESQTARDVFFFSFIALDLVFLEVAYQQEMNCSPLCIAPA